MSDTPIIIIIITTSKVDNEIHTIYTAGFIFKMIAADGG
ncbi:predicted protein [Plenodomus lingam JN3]|uniref:Predicted protein n=1 Tax=Leptosphaeria maculans (strain JN3 / isolate v23.1.3 / race Av1-4-5-6-7-8) TaxID=985895 RepID=E5ACK3_LEPMJ|nr:predicted protein [Plenodomus lingam JN3]CBY02205.1 predicted protein [Plenodomus lingam JN3]